MDKMWILWLTFFLLSFVYTSAVDVTLPFKAKASLDTGSNTNTNNIQRFILNTTKLIFSEKLEVSSVKNTSADKKVNFTGVIIIHCKKSTSWSCKESNDVLNYALGSLGNYRNYFKEPLNENKTDWPNGLANVYVTINCSGASTVKKCPHANKSTGTAVGLGVGLSIAAVAGLLIAAGILYRKCCKSGQVGSDNERKRDGDDENSPSGSSTTDSATPDAGDNPFSAANMPASRSDKASKTKFTRIK